MDPRDNYVIQVLREKEHAQQLAAAWCGLACSLQALLAGTGQPAGLPPLHPSMPLEALLLVQGQLDARLVPPAPAENGALP